MYLFYLKRYGTVFKVEIVCNLDTILILSIFLHKFDTLRFILGVTKRKQDISLKTVILNRVVLLFNDISLGALISYA